MSTQTTLRNLTAFGGSIAPALSARVARNLLLRPRPHERRSWELPAADSGRRITFRFGLSGLRWGEQGPAVLMLHGWEGRPTQFHYFIEPLLKSGRQVIALDGPAHGQSYGEESTLMEFALALQEAAVEIPELESVIGHSMGAAAAAIALSQGLPAEKAVLIAGPSAIEESLYGFAGQFGLPRTAAKRFVHLIEQANGVTAKALEVSQHSPVRKIPVLVVHDRQDAAVPFRDGEAIAQHWPGARLLATEGLGHWRVLTDASVVREVADFLIKDPQPAPQPVRHDPWLDTFEFKLA